MCADHPGPRAGAQLPQQPDVEQSPWGPVRSAAVLRIPGRLPLLLRHAGSVTHTNTHTNSHHQLYKVRLHNSNRFHAPVYCNKEVTHKGQSEKFPLHPSLRFCQYELCVCVQLWFWNLNSKKNVPRLWSTALLQQQQVEWTNGPLTDVCISPADTSARPSLLFESALPLLLLRRGQFLPLRFSGAGFSPPPHHPSPHICNPGAAPSLTPVTPSSAGAATHTHTHSTNSVDGAPGVESGY